MFEPNRTANNFHYIDYKQPLSRSQNDMRTAYEFGHRYQILNDRIGPPSGPSTASCTTANAQPMRHPYVTESQQQYVFKAQPRAQTAERAPTADRVRYVQTQQERIFRRAPKALASGRSQYQRDFEPVQRRFDSIIVPLCLPGDKAPAASQLPVQANRPGHHKFLDPYATTNMLELPQHSIEQQTGIGRKDNVTLWDWLGYPKGKGFGLHVQPVTQLHGPTRNLMVCRPVATAPPPMRVIPKGVKAVPHNGMQSEQRAEYRCRPAPVCHSPLVSGD